MTKEEILNMEAGPEIDALFAERVMVWEKRKADAHRFFSNYWSQDEIFKCHTSDWHPSTNISHAMQGVERMEDPWFSLTYQGNQWCCKVGFGQAVVGAEIKELAITRARILWAMEKEATNVREIPTE